MNKKTVLMVVRTIVELLGILLLILIIIYLLKSKNGILVNMNNENAQEKLDSAIKIFATTEGMELTTALEEIEGLNSLQINEETGEYNIIIDGQEFFVMSQELIPEKK